MELCRFVKLLLISVPYDFIYLLFICYSFCFINSFGTCYTSNEGKGAGAVIITTEPITILQSRCKTSQSNSAAEETALELALQTTEPQQELLIISDNLNTLRLISNNPEPKTSLQQNIHNLLLNRPNITTAHIYSHQQDKLEKDKHKWEPKIKAQQANFPINYTYAQ